MPLRPEDKVLLDVCCGRWGWSKEFAKRGWRCIGIDSLEHETPPEGCKLVRMNLLSLGVDLLRKWGIRFAVASTPCDEFAPWGMRHFHKDPKPPKLGIELFKHTHRVLNEAGIPFVMENVRAAQQFVGQATCNAGAFHLWHNFGDFPLVFGVPFRLPQGLTKGLSFKRRDGRYGGENTEVCELMYGDKKLRKELSAIIPLELAACVADYAERILEQNYAKESSAVPSEPLRASALDDGDELDRAAAQQRKLAVEGG